MEMAVGVLKTERGEKENNNWVVSFFLGSHKKFFTSFSIYSMASQGHPECWSR